MRTSGGRRQQQFRVEPPARMHLQVFTRSNGCMLRTDVEGKDSQSVLLRCNSNYGITLMRVTHGSGLEFFTF